MATLWIQTDKNQYQAGQTVNGNVLLYIKAKIKGPQAISLTFTGYQIVKWIEQSEIPPPSLTSAKSPVQNNNPVKPEQIYHIDKLSISECDQESLSSNDLHPKYIRTPENRYYALKHHQNRNLLTKNKINIHKCSELEIGQYSFPFSLKTFTDWPGSFSYQSNDKRATISYNLTAAIEPVSPHFQFSSSRQLILHENRTSQKIQKQSSGDIVSCFCLSKGSTLASVFFQKNGYFPNEEVHLSLQIDNSQCTAEISTITLQLTNNCLIKTSEIAQPAQTSLWSKTINGMNAGQSFMGQKCIRQHFPLPEGVAMRPTSSGKLVNNQYELKVKLNHKTLLSMSKTNAIVGELVVYNKNNQNTITDLPNPWNPKVMPATNIPIISNIGNNKQKTMDLDKITVH